MDDHTRDSTTAVWAMLDRYLAGEASVEETATIQAMLARIPDAESILRLESRGRRSEGALRTHSASDWATEGISERWNAIVEQLALDDSTSEQSKSEYRVSRKEQTVLQGQVPLSITHKFARGALIGALGLCIAMVGWWTGIGKVRNDLSTYVSTYSTPPGKQATVTLPDGTELLLNVDSKVQVAGDFMNGNRSVRLVGEAIFTVVHHTADPFVVITNNVRTKVLGTTFAVRAYPNDSVTTVAVKDGRVAVNTVVVGSGEQLQIKGRRPQELTLVPSKAGRHNFLFADGIVALNDARLGDAAHDLERWYDTRIHFEDESLKDLRISGEFSAKSIYDLIEVLEGIFKVKVTRVGNSVTISKR
jgi:ferric-dicitrate binding protein FerR (iron transport regulator)